MNSVAFVHRCALARGVSRLVVLTVSMMSLAAAGAESQRPNILFAIADDWSFGHAGAYDCAWVRTPAFDRVAGQGILFTRAYTPNAKCAPSRACIVTGRSSWQLEAAANHIPQFPARFPSFIERLAENGFRTGMTGKGWAPGVAVDDQGRPRAMTGRPFQKHQAQPSAKGIARNDYARNFEEFLSAVPAGEPWIFWYGALEPHRGYEFGSGAAKGGKKLSDIDRVPGYWPDNEVVRHDMLDYAFEVEHFDTHLGRMLALLEERGVLDDTVVIVTSDHGMPFPRAKGQEYEASNHVPLAIMWGNGIDQPGRVCRDYVSFIDLAPTLVRLAGLNWDEIGMPPSPGQDWTPILRSPKPEFSVGRDYVLIGKERHDVGRPNDWGYPIRGIVRDDLLYLRNFETSRWPAGNPETGYLNCDGGPTKTEVLKARLDPARRQYWEWCFGKRPAEELYNLADDPDCLTNLAKQPAFDAKRETLKEKLFRELKAQGDPRVSGNGAVFESYPYAGAQRGFYERFMSGEKIEAGWVNESDFETGKEIKPSHPQVFDVRAFGAEGDGKTDDTRPIQRAIDACGRSGGGRVVFPEGHFRSGTIRLRDGVALHLTADARLVGHEDQAVYEGFESPNWSGRRWNRALVIGEDLRNIAISGDGLIDGNNVFDPQGEEKMRGPHTIMLMNCTDVVLRDVTIRDSANYAFLFYACERVRVEKATFEGGWDGVHFRGADEEGIMKWNRDVRIAGCKFYTGDDCIAGHYIEDAVVEDCVVNSSCNGVRLIGPARRLSFNRCQFFGPGRNEHRTSREHHRTNMLAGILLQPSAWGATPGPLDTVTVSDVTMQDVACPLHVSIREGNTGGGLAVERMKATGVYGPAISVESWADAPLGRVTLRDIDVAYTPEAFSDPRVKNRPDAQAPIRQPGAGIFARILPAWGLYGRNVEDLHLERVRFTTSERAPSGPVIRADDVGTLRLEHLQYSPVADEVQAVECRDVEKVEREDGSEDPVAPQLEL